MPIPPMFHDEDHGKPYRNCRICELDLHHPPQPYLVEKIVRKNAAMGMAEVQFAYAVCLDCVAEMQSQVSEESAERIRDYVQSNADWQQRLQLVELASEDPMRLVQRCLISGRPLGQVQEYQIAALCDGEELILSLWPYALSGEVIQEMSDLLSQETLGHLDDFYGQHFGLPPEWADLFRDRPVFWL